MLTAPDGNREILARWLLRQRTVDAKNLEPTSWQFASLQTRGNVVFTAASGKQALAREAGIQNIRQLKDHGDGTATYAIDLSR